MRARKSLQVLEDGGGEGREEDYKAGFMIPVSFQSDMEHIHRKARFTGGGE
jgi:hypothetical protein